MSKAKLTRVSIYWDTQDPSDPGWAYSIDRKDAKGTYEETGGLYVRRDAKLPRLLRALKFEAGNLSESWPRVSDFTRYEHDGGGWEYKARGGA